MVDVGDQGGEPVPVAGELDDTAYLIYTSGSTGKPKGVMVSHRNLATFAAGVDDLLGDESGTWLAVTSMSFDISVLELLWTLARGYEVVVRATEPTRGRRSPVRPVDFSLFYFGNVADGASGDPDPYKLLKEGARFADQHGFAAVWTPERHFHRFGGLYPNPSVIGGLLAGITDRIAIRAGSVVLPLHDPLRVAEEWALVDNLSAAAGSVSPSPRAGIHATSRLLLTRTTSANKRCWTASTRSVGCGAARPYGGVGGDGTEVELGTFPRPVSPELPVWLTSARHPDTFRAAGEVGAGLLTHLLGHDIEELASKIALYRKAWADAGHPGEGRVAVMVHTYVGPSAHKARQPLADYLKTSWDLLAGLADMRGDQLRSLPPDELDALVDRAVGRFAETAALIGTPEQAADTVARLADIGVDEVACLIDFGVGADDVLAGLDHLAEVPALVAQRAEEPLADQLRRHHVTHLQCTRRRWPGCSPPTRKPPPRCGRCVGCWSAARRCRLTSPLSWAPRSTGPSTTCTARPRRRFGRPPATATGSGGRWRVRTRMSSIRRFGSYRPGCLANCCWAATTWPPATATGRRCPLAGSSPTRTPASRARVSTGPATWSAGAAPSWSFSAGWTIR
nr:MupA/Atu3671 family FMN-dependent luciferase-like monooxygenase [Fodinicola feengrottensis]